MITSPLSRLVCGPRPAGYRPPPDWRRFAARLLLLLVIGLLAACSKTVDLQSGLNDTEANEIISVLDRSGIKAHKRTTKEGISLAVEEHDLSRATEVLNAAGLPRRNLADLGALFKKEGMISTPLEERARYIHGLSSELEYTLQQFDRVIAARVHVVLPERVAPGEPIQPSSAAVFLKYRPPLDEDMVAPRVRNLVASSIPGLSGEDGRAKVSVVMVASEMETPPVEWVQVGPFQVVQDSVTLLRLLLFVCGAAVVTILTGAIALAVRRHPKAAALADKLLRKRRAAGQVTEAGSTTSGGTASVSNTAAPAAANGNT